MQNKIEILTGNAGVAPFITGWNLQEDIGVSKETITSLTPAVRWGSKRKDPFVRANRNPSGNLQTYNSATISAIARSPVL